MAINKKRRMGECVHCGKFGPITVDHVPPKNLFPKPLPNNMITVFSCDDCNNGASADDEYFRLILSMSIEVQNSNSVKKLLPRIERSLLRPNYPGLLKTFVKSTKLTDAITEAGIYVGKIPVYDVNSERVKRVLKRVINGIVYETFHYRLPDNYLRVWWSIDALNLDQNQMVIFIEMVEKLSKVSFTKIGIDVFKYKLLRAHDDEYCFWGAFTFYENFTFLFVTIDETSAREKNYLKLTSEKHGADRE